MEIYIYLYLLVLFGFLFNVNKRRRNKLFYLTVVFGSMVFVAAFRSSNVGTDLKNLYAPYYPYFVDVSWKNVQTVTASEHWEWGFCAFCKVLCSLSIDKQFFIIVSSLIAIIPYAIFIYKNSKDVVFSTFFYISFHVYMISLNIVRQSIAIGIVILGYEFLKKRQYLKYSLFVFIATLFHTSAIIAIILIFFDLIKYKKSYIVWVAVCMLAFAASYTYIFQWLLGFVSIKDQYGFYEIGQGHFSGFITYHTLGMFVIALITFLVMSINAWRIKNKDSEISFALYAKGWTFSFLTYATLIAAFFRLAAFFANVTSRMSYYFIPFLMIAFPNSLGYLVPEKGKRLKILMVLILTVFYFIVLTRARDNWGTVPYELCKSL